MYYKLFFCEQIVREKQPTSQHTREHFQSYLFIYLFIFYPRECDNQYIKYVLEYTQTHIP